MDPIRHAEFRVYVADIILDRLLRDEELFGYLVVVVGLRDEIENLHLPVTEGENVRAGL